MDISLLLNLDAKLLYFDNANPVNDDLIEHINMQSQFFNKNLELVEYKSKNPLLDLKFNPYIIHCLGFEKQLFCSYTILGQRQFIKILFGFSTPDC